MPKQQENDGFQEALRRIEEARRSNSTALNLGNLKLIAFPESLGQFSQLQYLDLSNNGLAAFPESLGHESNRETGFGVLVRGNIASIDKAGRRRASRRKRI